MGLLFFPRGGSAQVVRYLSRSLPGAGWDVERSPAGRWAPRASSRTPAPSSRGLDVHPLDYTRLAGRRRPGGGRPALPSLLRGPARGAGPGVRVGGRARVRAPGGRLGAPARAGRRGRGRPAAPAPPDADQRGGGAGLPGRAARRPHPRHRAGHGARDRRRRAARVGARRGVGGADAALGARVRAAARALARRRGAGARACSASSRSGWSGRPTASSPSCSSRGPSAATSGWRTGAAGSSRTPRAGTRRASPGASATRRRTSTAFAGDSRALHLQRALHGAQADPADDRAPTPRRAPASSAARRSCCWAAFPGSSRGRTRSR